MLGNDARADLDALRGPVLGAILIAIATSPDHAHRARRSLLPMANCYRLVPRAPALKRQSDGEARRACPRGSAFDPCEFIAGRPAETACPCGRAHLPGRAFPLGRALSNVQLKRIDAFVPICGTAIFVNDLITAVFN